MVLSWLCLVPTDTFDWLQLIFLLFLLFWDILPFLVLFFCCFLLFLAVVALRSAVSRHPLCKSDCMPVSCCSPQNHRLRERNPPKKWRKPTEPKDKRRTLPDGDTQVTRGRFSSITSRKILSNISLLLKIYFYQVWEFTVASFIVFLLKLCDCVREKQGADTIIHKISSREPL